MTPQNITFEGLNGSECQKWWQDTPDNDLVKQNLHKAQVEWAVRMPVFPIREYEGALRFMVDTFERHTCTNTFEYLRRDVTISFKAGDFTGVFGIPGSQGKKIDLKAKKMTREEKERWIKLISRNLMTAEWTAWLVPRRVAESIRLLLRRATGDALWMSSRAD